MPTLAESLFSIAGLVVLPGWALLVFFPWWRWSTGLVPGVIIPAVLGLLYGGLMATNFLRAEGGFGSLADVARLFENPYLLLAGWVHYLAFDLFIGAWEVRDGGSRSITYWSYRACCSPSCWAQSAWRSTSVFERRFDRCIRPGLRRAPIPSADNISSGHPTGTIRVTNRL